MQPTAWRRGYRFALFSLGTAVIPMMWLVYTGLLGYWHSLCQLGGAKSKNKWKKHWTRRLVKENSNDEILYFMLEGQRMFNRREKPYRIDICAICAINCPMGPMCSHELHIYCKSDETFNAQKISLLCKVFRLPIFFIYFLLATLVNKIRDFLKCVQMWWEIKMHSSWTWMLW